MHNVALLIIHIFIALSLIGVILIQRNSSDGLGGLSGGGNAGGDAFMSGRASATFLTRLTVILAVLFMLSSLLLAKLSSMDTEHKSLMDTPVAAKQVPAAPVAPSVPVAK